MSVTESAVRFRQAREGDVPALQALVHAAYRGDSARRGWTHEADLLDGTRITRELLADMLQDPAQTILLSTDGDGGLSGCVGIRSLGGGRAYLGMLTVDPARQAAGLGRALLEAAEAFAREEIPAREMEMTVIAQRTELIAWYLRRGYALTGETRPFPAHDSRFGEPQVENLHFVVLSRVL